MFIDFINTLMNGGIIVLMMSKVLMSQWTDLRSAMPADITEQREVGFALHWLLSLTTFNLSMYNHLDTFTSNYK